MRVNTIADDLRQAANGHEMSRALFAQAAAEIEFLRGGYTRILSISPEAEMRGEAKKIAAEYV